MMLSPMLGIKRKGAIGMETVVAASALQKTYGQGESEVHALAGVDVQVRAGQFVAIMAVRFGEIHVDAVLGWVR